MSISDAVSIVRGGPEAATDYLRRSMGNAIVDAMLQDKKVQRGALTLILVRRIGESFIAKNVAAADVRNFLEAELRGAPQRQYQD